MPFSSTRWGHLKLSDFTSIFSLNVELNVFSLSENDKSTMYHSHSLYKLYSSHATVPLLFSYSIT